MDQDPIPQRARTLRNYYFSAHLGELALVALVLVHLKSDGADFWWMAYILIMTLEVFAALFIVMSLRSLVNINLAWPVHMQIHTSQNQADPPPLPLYVVAAGCFDVTQPNRTVADRMLQVCRARDNSHRVALWCSCGRSVLLLLLQTVQLILLANYEDDVLSLPPLLYACHAAALVCQIACLRVNRVLLGDPLNAPSMREANNNNNDGAEPNFFLRPAIQRQRPATPTEMFV